MDQAGRQKHQRRSRKQKLAVRDSLVESLKRENLVPEGVEAVSKLDCLKPYLLVGGTALALQLHTRQSEDLIKASLMEQK